MKITIEKINGEKAKLNLELGGKVYSEVWQKEDDGSYSTDLPISEQLKENEDAEDVEYDGLIDFLNSIEMDEFVNLCLMY